MASYFELKEQAEKLLAEAEQVRLTEIRAAIAEIKQKMHAYGLTLQDLRHAGIDSGMSKPAAKSKSPAKYKGPNGQTWSGGRGRKPDWVQQALKEGKSLEEFKIAA